MNLLKNIKIKRQIKRLDRLVYLLNTNARIAGLDLLREVITADWAYYFHFTGHLGEHSFSFHVWEHKTTLKTRCSVCDTTDPEIVDELIKLVKDLSGVELDQKKFPNE